LIRKKNTQIDLTTIFNLQRAIYGKTESFPAMNDSVNGTKIKQDANFLDYFALKTNFKSSIENWNFNLEAQTNSLDFEKLDKIVEINSNLKKRFYEKNSSNFNESGEIRLFGAYNDKTSNGSLGDITVNSAYGLRYNFDSRRKTENNTKSNLASITYGRYSAPERTNANTLETRNRLNLSLKQINEYKLWYPKLKEFIDKENKYRPYNISKGLYWLTEVNLDFFRYDNGDKQDLLLIKTGPKIILGNFKNDFFDYTEFSLYPRFKFNKGKSPFSFDQVVDNKVIELNIKQQIYKSLALKLSADINLEDDTSDDEKLINPTIDISLNRRAYDVSIYYNFDSEVGGIKFNVFSFDFDGLGEKF